MSTAASRQASTDNTDRPLAPASWSWLVGVSALAMALLYAASTQFTNDWLRVAGCAVVLAGSAFLLHRSGLAEAQAHPHPVYRSDRLPTEKSVLKNVIVLLVLLALVFYAIQTSTAEDFGSPFPYFVAVGFLYLVLPQLMARRIVRRHTTASGRP